MATLNLNVRVEASDKKSFEQFCNSVGMNISTAVKTNTFDGTIYEELKKAELEMSNTSKRYSQEEILESMNDIIG